MKKNSIYLLMLLLITGCATTQGPEPTISDTTRPERPPEARSAYVPPARESVMKPEPAPRQQDQAIVAKAVEPKPRDLTAPEHAPPPKIAEPPAAAFRGLTKLVEANEEKLLNVSKGMDKYSVEKIMESAHNPYKRERIAGKDGASYEVFFYLTREPRKGKPITERLMTPVIFKNNEVIAMGSFQLKKLRNSGTLGRAKKARAGKQN
jgi:hypothetical protein